MHEFFRYTWKKGGSGLTNEDAQRQQAVGFLVRELNNEMKKRRERNCPQECEGLTMMQAWVIGYLAHHPDHDIYQKELEENLKIGKSTLTEVLHLMEKNDLVRREAVEKDRRFKRIVLTDKSKRIHEDISREIKETEEKLKAGIPPGDLEVFVRTIRKMIGNIKET